MTHKLQSTVFVTDGEYPLQAISIDSDIHLVKGNSNSLPNIKEIDKDAEYYVLSFSYNLITFFEYEDDQKISGLRKLKEFHLFKRLNKDREYEDENNSYTISSCILGTTKILSIDWDCMAPVTKDDKQIGTRPTCENLIIIKKSDLDLSALK